MKRFKGYRVKVDPMAGQNITMKGHKLTIGPGVEPFLENLQALRTIIVKGELKMSYDDKFFSSMYRMDGQFLAVFQKMHELNPNKPEQPVEQPSSVGGPISEDVWKNTVGRGNLRPVFEPIKLDFSRLQERLTADIKRMADMTHVIPDYKTNSMKKEFSLAEALAGKKVITADGKPVTDIKNFGPHMNGGFSVFAVCDGEIINFNSKGVQPRHCGATVFMAMEKKTGFVNIYEQIRFLTTEPVTRKTGAPIYSTREEAVKSIKGDHPFKYLCTAPIEWFE